MNVIDLLRYSYALQIVVLGSAVLGVTSGALGCFAVLRRQSLLGDAIAHAALPGVAVVFLLTRSKAPLVLVCGAAAAGWLATLLVLGIVRGTRVKYDSALGLVMASFFGFGYLLLSYIQQLPDARQAGRGFWAPGASRPRCAAATAAPRRPSARDTGAAAFRGNTSSRVYHAPWCRNYDCRDCTRVFRSEAEARAAGFRPAGDCLRR